ncbi:MAG: TRL-like family protein [Treponema sp.]|nr:TRL-like family protein [Treponema sp.]
MNKIIVVMALAAICFLVAGCATITSPVVATTNPVGSKVGQASGKIWLGVFGSADAGIQAAAKNGGITNISTVDFTQKLGILGLWVEYETTVTGE